MGSGYVGCSIRGVVRNLTLPPILALALVPAIAHGQDAVSAINQSRLFAPPTAKTAEAFETPEDESAEETAQPSDESFGTQLILKSQERPQPFTVFGDVSGFYTNNVDLRPDHTRSDSFLVADAGAAWRGIISQGLSADASIATSIFRYNRASELDFERFSAGMGLSWVIPNGRGIVAYGRYDFAELINRHSDELLRDHEFTLGAQRTFVFNRSHFLTAGVSGIAGISTPHSQQRDQVAPFAAYHLQLSRSFSADVSYRYAAQFYNDGGRIDNNETLSISLGVAVTRWMRVEGVLSGAKNDSNRSTFSYDVLNGGGAVRAGIRF